MNSQWKRILPLVALLGVLTSEPAQAGAKLGVVATGNMVMTDLGTSITTPFAFGGGGLLLEFGGGKGRTGFEIGALYNIITIGAAGTSVTVTASSLNVPVLARFYLSETITFGAGGYYDMSLEDGGGSDYGLEGALGARLPLSKGKTSLILEGRYLYGLKESDGLKNQGISALVGMSFALGK